jgi:hypothetical protein
MIKINYPSDPIRLKAFHKAYYDKLSGVIVNIGAIDAVLSKVTMATGDALSLEKLLSAPFSQLADLNAGMTSLCDSDKAIIAALSAYNDMQPIIASFFMAQGDLGLSSCYYCNIDSIYAFSEFGDYRDPLDFIKRAVAAQFTLIKGIGAKKADVIVAKRLAVPFNSLDDCPVSPTILNRIKLRYYEPSHNHFTLDHFFHQAKHPYIRLCLYNFIPCCYACNSKFKIAAKLYTGSPVISSPSSTSFSFHEDVSFKVYLSVAEHDVSSLDDFSVDLVASRNKSLHAAFIKVLKLQGRYVHHKREALRLLKLKIEYPDTVLQELSDKLAKPIDELKRQLFGAELYDAEYDSSSLVKYKRDIARNIKLLEA